MPHNWRHPPKTRPHTLDRVTWVIVIAPSYSPISTTLEFADKASPCYPAQPHRCSAHGYPKTKDVMSIGVESILSFLLEHTRFEPSSNIPTNGIDPFYSIHGQALGGWRVSLSYPCLSLELNSHPSCSCEGLFGWPLGNLVY